MRGMEEVRGYTNSFKVEAERVHNAYIYCRGQLVLEMRMRY